MLGGGVPAREREKRLQVWILLFIVAFVTTNKALTKIIVPSYLSPSFCCPEGLCLPFLPMVSSLLSHQSDPITMQIRLCQNQVQRPNRRVQGSRLPLRSCLLSCPLCPSAHPHWSSQVHTAPAFSSEPVS